MRQKFLSALLLLTGVAIALGSLSHSFVAVAPVEHALARQAVPPTLSRSILAVWHFAGGCMAVLGGLVIWQWRQIHHGSRGQFFVPLVIGLFYVCFGVVAVVRFSAPFFVIFAVLGVCLLVCAGFQACSGTATGSNTGSNHRA